MDPRTIGSYGGPWVDARPVQNPQTQVAAASFGRLAEDAAQLTRAGRKALVTFRTTLANGAVAVLAARSQWGTGVSEQPTIARTGVGLYTVTFATSYADALGAVETVSFFDATGAVLSLAAFGHVQCTVAANVISVAVVDLAAAPTDLGGSVTISVHAT